MDNFVHDIPLNPNLANTYVDDTVGWATGHNKEAVAGTLRHQLKKMVHWCKPTKSKSTLTKHMSYLTNTTRLTKSSVGTLQ